MFLLLGALVRVLLIEVRVKCRAGLRLGIIKEAKRDLDTLLGATERQAGTVPTKPNISNKPKGLGTGSLKAG